MPPDRGRDERLHLRTAGGGPKPDGAVEVVYADEWDDLCDVAAALVAAVERLDPRKENEHARRALRSYYGD